MTFILRSIANKTLNRVLLTMTCCLSYISKLSAWPTYNFDFRTPGIGQTNIPSCELGLWKASIYT